jgi:hypothetical protein
MSVHVERVDREIVGREVQRLKDLSKGQMLSVPVDDHLLRVERARREWSRLGRERRRKRTNVGAPLHLALNESKHVFLIHAGRVVYVCIDLIPEKRQRSSRKGLNIHACRPFERCKSRGGILSGGPIVSKALYDRGNVLLHTLSSASSRYSLSST